MDLLSIVGQPIIVATLERALASQRVSHAYLLHGEQGLGKHTVAKAFARHLLCERGNACGECNSCQKLIHGNHSNYREIKPEGSIKIDEIRKIKEEVSLRVTGYRVWVISQAEKMTLQAANSFLKVLEEPTPGTVFILITDYLHQLLPTIVSRCQLLAFHRGYSGKTALLAGQDESQAAERRKTVIDRLIALPKMPIPEVLGLSQTWEEERAQVAIDLEIMVQWYRDLLIIKHGLDIALYNPDCKNDLQQISERYSQTNIHEIINKIMEMIPAIRGNVRPRFVIGHLLLIMHKGALT